MMAIRAVSRSLAQPLAARINVDTARKLLAIQNFHLVGYIIDNRSEFEFYGDRDPILGGQSNTSS